MQIIIDLSQTQYHAMSVLHPDVSAYVQGEISKMADRLIDRLYDDQIALSQSDPAYQLSPDRDAVILSMPVAQLQIRSAEVGEPVVPATSSPDSPVEMQFDDL